MKVVNNDHNAPLILTEMEACRQFEASSRDGQVLFQPQVAAGQPAPNCVAFFEEVGRFASPSWKDGDAKTTNGSAFCCWQRAGQQQQRRRRRWSGTPTPSADGPPPTARAGPQP